jgi:hypothetical protein
VENSWGEKQKIKDLGISALFNMVHLHKFFCIPEYTLSSIAIKSYERILLATHMW